MPATSTSTASAAPGELAGFDRLMATARAGPARTVAIVWPVERNSLTAAVEAQRLCGIRPLLVGDRERIERAAEMLGHDLTAAGARIVEARDDRSAAATAVRLVRSGEAEILMKGYIHTDDFLRPVLDKQTGLRTGRRMSHVFVCYLPERIYPKPLLVTDAAFNIAPDLETKLHIARNAVAVARALGVAQPKIAVLAAVEEVNPAMPATVDAAALTEAAARGEIDGALVAGPLAFDNAISREAALAKGIDSPVAGDPDVLLVPDIEAGNMTYKQMVYFSGAVTPGVVVGASAPVLLTSRNDPPIARTASCAVAAAMVNADPHRAARDGDPSV